MGVPNASTVFSDLSQRFEAQRIGKTPAEPVS
jgi:hypothetical protein